MQSIKKVALQIFKDYLQSGTFKKVPGWSKVYKWGDLLEWNRDNFLFMAQWHLAHKDIKVGAQRRAAGRKRPAHLR